MFPQNAEGSTSGGMSTMAARPEMVGAMGPPPNVWAEQGWRNPPSQDEGATQSTGDILKSPPIGKTEE